MRVVLVLLLSRCATLSCTSTPSSLPASPDAEAAAASPGVAAEAGFFEVPPRTVTVKGERVAIAATARLFYNLRPADDSPDDKPIFILFNGFADDIVRPYGTGPMTVAPGGDVVVNPTSFTRFANLVYVEPRQAGYSYDVLATGAPGAAECASSIFNEYVDAADVLLGVLQFLTDHPTLRGPVYWLGESYGGAGISPLTPTRSSRRGSRRSRGAHRSSRGRSSSKVGSRGAPTRRPSPPSARTRWKSQVCPRASEQPATASTRATAP
jgi:hypothetical protein